MPDVGCLTNILSLTLDVSVTVALTCNYAYLHRTPGALASLHMYTYYCHSRQLNQHHGTRNTGSRSP